MCGIHHLRLIIHRSLVNNNGHLVLNDGTVSNYGFGWMIEYNDQGKAVYHTGGLAGFRSNIFRDLKKTVYNHYADK